MSSNRRRGRSANADAEGEPEAPLAGAVGGMLHSPPINPPGVPPPDFNAGVHNQPPNENQDGFARMYQMQQGVIDQMTRTQQALERNHNNSMEQGRQQGNALLTALNNIQAAIVRQHVPRPVVPPVIPNVIGGVNPANNAGNQQNANHNGNRTHHLKTSDIRIPVYTGAHDTKTPYDYILELEKYAAVVGYSDEEMLRQVIPLSLVDDAYKWYRYEPPFQDWSDFKIRVRREFQAIGYSDDLRREMEYRYQGTNETLTSFIRVIVDYLERLGDERAEQEIVRLIKRLMHPDYRKALIGMQTDTLNELKAAAPHAQELIKSYRSYRLPPTSGLLEPSLAWRPVRSNDVTQVGVTENAASNLTDNQRNVPKLHFAAVDPYSFYHSKPQKEVRFQSPSSNSNENRQRSRTPSPSRPNSQFRSTSPNRFSPERREMRCYICNSPTHLARYCDSKPGASENANSSQKKDSMLISDDEIATVALAHKDKRPFMQVTLLSKQFMAYLDTGSSVSVLGDDVIAEIKAREIKCKKSNKVIRFLKGDYCAEMCITLDINYYGNLRKHCFLLVPGTIKSVLLGRDFLGPAKIGVFIGFGGWMVGSDNQKVVPFEDYDGPFLSEAYHNNTFCDDETVSYKYPAEVLSMLHHENDEEEEKLQETSLFPDTKYNEIKVPLFLNNEQVQMLYDLLHEFLPIFTKAPGMCSAFKHTINTGDHKPVSTTLKPMSPGKKRIFDESFFELIKYDIIEPSKSPWSANPFVLRKKDGSLRPIIDYRDINKITVPDVYPIPRMDEMLAILGPCKYFTVLDMAKGFFQIEVEEGDRLKTAFICEHGLFQYKRMPMGLRNSPSTFQRCVDAILGDLKGTICSVYFDDLCVYSKTFDEHVHHIKLVLDRIRDAGITIHPGKVQLCRTRFKYLGFIIEPGTCLPDPAKVEVLHSYPRPRNAKEVQKFIGFVGFYRRFIPEFSKFSKPLTSLLKKGTRFIWDAQTELGFMHLKNSLSEKTLLYLPDMSLPYIIQSDGSNVGYGAILLQERDGIRHPIWFASKTLTPAETKYSTFEKEVGAALWAIERFRGYVEYSNFVLETDHQAISWLHKLKDPSGRLGRWAMQLQMYDFQVRYRAGSCQAMKPPDALSRIAETLICFDEDVENLKRSNIIKAQEDDEKLSRIIIALRRENADEHLKKSSCLTEDGLLLKYVGTRNKPWEDERLHWRVWIPEALQSTVISAFHSNTLMGHAGIRKTYGKLEQRVYWPNLRRDVQRYVNHCLVCQQSKRALLPKVPASSFQVNSPWDLVTIDLMGPYKKGVNQSTHLLVIVDYFSRFVEMYPLRATRSEVIIQKLWDTFCRWGTPRYLLSDNATQFTSNLYMNWCASLGIKPYYISAYHPQANLTERYNKFIKSMIIATTERCKDWDKHIPELSFAIRTCISDSAGYTPAYINFGRELRTPFDNLMQIELSNVSDISKLGKRMATIRGVVMDEIERSKVKYLSYYNAKAAERSFKVGDLVWMRTHFLSDAARGITASLSKKREGPYKVSQIVSTNVYDLISVSGDQKVNKVHINELSPYCSNESSKPNTAATSKSEEKEAILSLSDDAISHVSSGYDGTVDATAATAQENEQITEGSCSDSKTN